ncbi:MAG: formylglycine-generating enzyme family protein [Alphaproteobacteria bacterium]|nr:formylglycine-generating enzyme family protein [Alphaproteobacteria bacterium]
MKRLAFAALFSGLFTPVCDAQTIYIRNFDPGYFGILAKGAEVSLSNTVDVQQLVDGRWIDVDNVSLLDCGKTPQEDVGRMANKCITLQADTALVPPPWSGDVGEPQCSRLRRSGAPLPPGTFRFAVKSCRGIDIWVGPSFEMLSVRGPQFAAGVADEALATTPPAVAASPCASEAIDAPSSSREACPLSAAAEHSLKPKDVFKECDKGCPEMVVVPPGSFIMGSPESEKGRMGQEGPQHRITIARPFAVGRFAVTFEEWDACASEGGCAGYKPDDRGWGRGRRPVINVSWEDAKRYLSWLSKNTGKDYRLLSEAEWEYAARAGTTTPFWWGLRISPKQANYGKDLTQEGGVKSQTRHATLPVESFEANPFGLYQVHGNVSEWVEDCLHDGYCCRGRPTDGSAWTTGECSGMVLRGGSWNNAAWELRAAMRKEASSFVRRFDNGFRVARTLTP